MNKTARTACIIAVVAMMFACLCAFASLAQGASECRGRVCEPQQPGMFQVWEKPPPVRFVKTLNPAFVKVAYELGDRGDAGTGTIVAVRGDKAYVLTCWHTFRDYWPRGKAFVYVRGKRVEAAILKVDRLWDLVILGIPSPGIPAVRIAETLPRRGDSLWSFGLRTGTLHGRLEKWYAPNKTAPDDMLGLTGARCTQPGDSGGAIINARGRLVGVISGGKNERGLSCVGTCFPRIRAILRGVLPPYPNRPGIVIPKRRPVVPIGPPPTQARPPPTAALPTPAVPTLPVPPTRPQANNFDCESLEREVADLKAKVTCLEKRIAQIKLQPVPTTASVVAAVLVQLREGPLFTARTMTPEELAQQKLGETTTQEIRLGGTLSLGLLPVSKQGE